MNIFFDSYKIPKKNVIDLINLCIKILIQEPNVVDVSDPVTVVGDIHGQMYDMSEIFREGLAPGTRNYVFLGDYVDRGAWSVEVFLLVIALKISYPQNVFILRGNHESRSLTGYFGFRNECLMKYDQEVYDAFMSVCDALPVGAVINRTFACFHGGISPSQLKISEFNKSNRFGEIYEGNFFNDLIWADPVDKSDGQLPYMFVKNSQRRTSVVFGAEALSIFLKTNNLKTLLRGHEVFYEGYKAYNWKDPSTYQIMTVFSAPNYTGSYNNLGAVLLIDVR